MAFSKAEDIRDHICCFLRIEDELWHRRVRVCEPDIEPDLLGFREHLLSRGNREHRRSGRAIFDPATGTVNLAGLSRLRGDAGVSSREG